MAPTASNQGFLETMTTLDWWLSVVVVGVITHLSASYLKPWLDKRLSGMSAAWARRTEARKKEYDHDVQVLAASPDERAWLMYQDSRCRHRCTVYFIWTVLLLFLRDLIPHTDSAFNLVMRIVGTAFPAICMVMGVVEHLISRKFDGMLDEARKLRRR